MSDDPLDGLLTDLQEYQPGYLQPLGAAFEAAWNVVDPVVLELCRLRIAMILGDATEFATRTGAAVRAGLGEATVAELASWPTSDPFGPRERACLALCEQYIIDVANVDDDLTAPVADYLGSDGLMNFITALLVLEQRQRLRLTWLRVFADADVAS